jgi:hypothetical protein
MGGVKGSSAADTLSRPVVTLCGGLVIVASQPLRLVLSTTSAWLAFAGWAIGRMG